MTIIADPINGIINRIRHLTDGEMNAFGDWLGVPPEATFEATVRKMADRGLLTEWHGVLHAVWESVGEEPSFRQRQAGEAATMAALAEFARDAITGEEAASLAAWWRWSLAQ